MADLQRIVEEGEFQQAGEYIAHWNHSLLEALWSQGLEPAVFLQPGGQGGGRGGLTTQTRGGKATFTSLRK